MQQSNSAGNQQATVSEAEKGWLAGLIDGEGCIHIDLDKNGAHPYLTVTNTNFAITDKVWNIWQRLGIGARVQTRRQNHKSWSPVRDVQVIGYNRLKPALIAIMPYLVGKSDEALLLYRFIESRLARYGGHWRKIPNGQRNYSQEESDLIQAIKDKKSRYRVLRDYKPDHSNMEDIVRATRRRVEVVRNVQPRLISE